jgi:hypothetical protein
MRQSNLTRCFAPIVFQASKEGSSKNRFDVVGIFDTWTTLHLVGRSLRVGRDHHKHTQWNLSDLARNSANER